MEKFFDEPGLIYKYKKEEDIFKDPPKFLGCPSVALSRNGRLFLSVFKGGKSEPDMDNFHEIVYSDDFGKTWSDPVLIVCGDKERGIHTVDMELWVDPKGVLHIYWVQDVMKKADQSLLDSIAGKYEEDVPYVFEYEDKTTVFQRGYYKNIWFHDQWEMTVENPDASVLEFSKPRFIYKGFLRNKPLVTKSGKWIFGAYNQAEEKSRITISEDEGKTYRPVMVAKRLLNWCDEAMAYQLEDGSIRFMIRTGLGKIGESYSYDDGETWTEFKLNDINNPNSRFYIKKSETGRVVMIGNDSDTDVRDNMTLYISEDDGKTWKKHLIDPRDDISYPDCDSYKGIYYGAYDRERTGAKEIIFFKFTEEDLLKDTFQPELKIAMKIE